MPSKLKPILFVAFGDPADDPQLALPGLQREEQNIREEVNQVCELGSWDYVSGLDCTRSDLVDHFKSQRVAVFHFGGHAGRQGVWLPKETSGDQIVNGVVLEEFLAEQKNLQLAFFNACSTQEWAQKLAETIPYVVATLCPVEDQQARDFASAFYAALAADDTIEHAFEVAKHAVTLQHETLNPAPPPIESDPDPVLGRVEFRRMDLSEADTPAVKPFPWILCSNGKLTPELARWTFSVAAHDPLIGLPPLDLADYVLPDRPYVSIKGHTEADAPLFFGRGAEIRALYDWLLRPSGGAPILLFFGQSGAGKSSLLNAGLLPRLRKNCSVEYRRRGTDLLDDLDAALSQPAEDWLTSQQAKLIILDQVEEAITHRAAPRGNEPPPPDELAMFVARLKEIFLDPATGNLRHPASKARIILSFRKEYLAEIRGLFTTGAIDGAGNLIELFWLDRLNTEAVIEIIEGPVRRADLRDKYKIQLQQIGPDTGFAEFLASKLNDPNSPIATTLQILLNKLWDKARENGGEPYYTTELYDSLSALDNPLAGFYDEQLDKLFAADTAGQYRNGLELDLLVEHTTELGTSQRRTLSELKEKYPHSSPAELEQLICRNKDLYLLAEPARDSGEDEAAISATVLAHDTLAPIIRRDLALSLTPGARARRLLENRGREWIGGKKGDVLDAADLRVVERGLSQMRAPTPEENELLLASRARRRKRREAWAAWSAVALVVVGVLFALFQVRTQKTDAITQYEGLSNENLKANQLIGLLESMQAANLWRESRLVRFGQDRVGNAVAQNLLAALSGTRELGRYPIDWRGILAQKCGVAVDNRGRMRFRSGDSQESFDGNPVPDWFGKDEPLAVDCDPATGRMVSVAADGTVKLWQNGATKERKIPALANANGLTSVALDPASNRIAALWGGDPIYLADLDSGAVQQFSSRVGNVMSIRFGGSGTFLGISGQKGAQIWNLKTGKPVLLSKMYPEYLVRDLQFGANAKGVLMAGREDNVPLEDNVYCTVIPVVRVPGSPAVYAGSDDELAHYNYSCETRPAEALAFAISPDGKQIAVGRSDGGTDVWEIPAERSDRDYHERINDMGKPADQVTQAAFSPDGRSLAVSNEPESQSFTDASGTVRVWLLDLERKLHREQNPSAQSIDELLAIACERVSAYLETPAAQRENPTPDDRLDLSALQSACKALPTPTVSHP